jgi:hypothetical protein
MGDDNDEREPRTYYVPATPLTAVNTLLAEITGWTLTWRQSRSLVTGQPYIWLAVVRVTDLAPSA